MIMACITTIIRVLWKLNQVKKTQFEDKDLTMPIKNDFRQSWKMIRFKPEKNNFEKSNSSYLIPHVKKFSTALYYVKTKRSERKS